MTYTISKIKNILGGTFLYPSVFDSEIEHLLIDSRKISFPETSLFFAIVGKRHDGHDFISDVYASGVRNFVVSNSDAEIIDYQRFTDANFVKVTDVLRGLQDLAAYHRSQFPNLKVIGITGSNGKTIVKEWLYQLLREDFNIVRSPKSYNSQVGVPLSVWQIRAEHNLAIFEAGISTKGEMVNLERIIQPTLGIFTMLGTAHTEGFNSDGEKLNEKLKLFKNASIVIVPKNIFQYISAKHHVFYWEKILENTVQIIDYKYFTINNKIECKIETPFKDAASRDNICTCWATLKALNFSDETIAERVSKLEPIAMRLELKSGVNGCIIVNDAYNSDLNSLQIALDFLTQQSRQLKRTVILSDILQSGQNADILYKKIADLLNEKGVSKLIGIGSEILNIKKFIAQKIDNQYFTSTDLFLKSLKNTDFQNEIVLLKGARPFAFEQIANRLALKAHKTVLEVNLNALSHNLLVFNKLLKEKTKIMAMVKASAYGQGSDEIARLLEFHNVDYLAVAYADEGIDLRNAGIRTPIMVMNPEEASFDAMHRFDLEPEIYSLPIFNSFVDFAQNTEGCDFKIHLKIDTGMHRLGFENADIQRVTQILNLNKNIKIASIFTHLAATEAIEHDPFTEAQIKRFSDIFDQITEGVGYKPMRHVLNSSGIARFPNYHFEMVRLGIGLYGIDSSRVVQDKLQIVQTLKATISQIRNVPSGDTVGYSRRGVLGRDSRIATISIGYADGLLRSAGNGKFSVFLHNQRAPIVGGVCMDMAMIDVTDIKEAIEGDEVEIFGSNVKVQELAAVLGTIPYEIFTNISERVKRVYFQE